MERLGIPSHLKAAKGRHSLTNAFETKRKKPTNEKK
jgi:hypothetical protein